MERKERGNGYRYSFKGSNEVLAELVGFITTERTCCGFFRFHLSVEDAEANVVLTISGPKGAKEFINVQIEPLLGFMRYLFSTRLLIRQQP